VWGSTARALAELQPASGSGHGSNHWPDPVGLHPTTLVVALQALATDEVSQTHGIGSYLLIRGYDYPRCRRALRRRGITPRIARRGIESSQRLGRHRYVVERSLAWLVGYRRLQVRYERRADLLLGFVHLACALICLKSLDGPKAAPSSA
jgi:transposase